MPKIKAKNRWTFRIFCGMMCGYKGVDLPRRGRENDEEREAERKIVEEVAV